LHLFWGAKAKLVDAKTYNNQVKHNLSALGVSTVGTLSMNKYELAKKINELEGLTNEEKSELLKLLRSQKKYGLVWEDKPEDAELRMVNEQPVLVEVPERAIVSDDAEAPNHILIEGDNLEALTALSYTHSGKIDVIYIDPPYNTGNKDFTYNDDYVRKEDGFRHSMWLTFMEKRLKLAKGLLSAKGVIFISIDDNEQATLRILCDELFGENNFIAQIVVASNSAKNNAKYVSVSHDYLLCYAKSIENLPQGWAVDKSNLEGFKKIAKKLLNSGLSLDEIHSELLALVKYPKYYEFDHYTYVDSKGPFRASDLTAPGSNSWFDILHPKTGMPCKIGTRGWAYSKDDIEKMIGEDKLLFGKDESIMPQLKNYLCDNEKSLPRSILFFDSQASTKWMKDQKLDFDFPKALDYIEYIETMYPANDYTILDFFAGSGTTLHATMKLNAKDGGHRQCILVQGIEKDERTKEDKQICKKITYERNRRVIRGYSTSKGKYVLGLSHNNLRYYKTKLVPLEQTLNNKRELMRLSTAMLCIKNNVYTEQEMFGGKKLNPNMARYFANDKTKMLVIYNEQTVQTFVKVIAGLNIVGKIMIYVFSNNSYAYSDDFEDVLDKVELCALPAAIYNVYKDVIPNDVVGEKKETLEKSMDDMEGEL